MELIITIILLTISGLGLLTAIGLFIGFIATSRSDNDVYLTDYPYDCDCDNCPDTTICTDNNTCHYCKGHNK